LRGTELAAPPTTEKGDCLCGRLVVQTVVS
jgi:hypothetical protein